MTRTPARTARSTAAEPPCASASRTLARTLRRNRSPATAAALSTRSDTGSPLMPRPQPSAPAELGGVGGRQRQAERHPQGPETVDLSHAVLLDDPACPPRTVRSEERRV